MKYLCVHHQQSLAINQEAALTLWRSAMEHGQQALQNKNFRLAQSFFGSAFEIVIIRLNVQKREGGHGEFSLEELSDAARLLATALCSVDQFDEAEQVLMFIHNYLLENLQEPKTTYDAKRHMMRLIEEFLKRATTLLRIRGKSSCAESMTLASRKTVATVRHAYLH